MNRVRLSLRATFRTPSKSLNSLQDPAFRLIGSEKVWERGVALTSRLQRFETEMLAEEENFARRVVAKVEVTVGSCSRSLGFIVTNLETDSRAVVRFNNKRGAAEQWIKEGKQAVKMTRLSCHRFRSNDVRLWLSVMACNLENPWRRLVLLMRIDTWSSRVCSKGWGRPAAGWSSMRGTTGC